MTQSNMNCSSKVTRRNLIRAGGAIGVAGLPGCSAIAPDSGNEDSGNGDSGNGDSGGGENPLNQITISHHPALSYGIPYMVAEEKGYFEDEGVDPPSEIFGSSGGGTTLRNLTSGELGYGVVSTAAVVEGYEAGSAVQIIGGAINTPGNIVFGAREDLESTDLSDTEGQSIGYTSPGSATQAVAYLCVEYADGVEVDDFEFVQLGGTGEIETALQQGDVDFGGIVPQSFPLEGVVQGFNAAEYVPEYSQLCQVIPQSAIDEYPDAVENYVAARHTAVEYLADAEGDAEMEEEIATIYANAGETTQEQAMSLVEEVDLGTYFTSSLTTEGLELVDEGAQLSGIRNNETEWEDLVDQRFLPEDLRIDL